MGVQVGKYLFQTLQIQLVVRCEILQLNLVGCKYAGDTFAQQSPDL